MRRLILLLAVTVLAPAAPALARPAAPPCVASQLLARADVQGATGSLLGGVVFSNRSATPCTLGGRPRTHLLDRSRLLAVQTFALPRQSGDPPVLRDVVLTPHGGAPTPSSSTKGKAFLLLWWSNWCKKPPAAVSVRVVLPHGGGRLTVRLNEAEAAPRCDQPKSPSRFGVGVVRPWRR
jgi:hypothetical protein